MYEEELKAQAAGRQQVLEILVSYTPGHDSTWGPITNVRVMKHLATVKGF